MLSGVTPILREDGGWPIDGQIPLTYRPLSAIA